MTRGTLLKLRDQTIAVQIAGAIKTFVGGEHKRVCATCGVKFSAHQRYHFFCSRNCRRAWYRGVFRPRAHD